MSVQSVAAVFFLCFLSLGNGGDSKELDILWEKYGDLRAEVEELKALHRKEQDESSSEESKEVDTEEETKREGEEDKKTENRGYTKFPVKFRSFRIFPTESLYKGCAIQIEAPMNARFQCYADNRPFLATPKPTKKPPNPIPNARYEMVGGLHQVTCFSRDEMCYLFVLVDPILSANVVIHTGNPESNLTISKDIISPEIGFRLYDQTQNHSYREAKVDFELQNVDALGNGQIEYGGELMWNNGSRLEINWSDWQLMKNVNLTLTETPLSKSETEVKLSVPTTQAKELRGLTDVRLKYIAETMEMGQYISLQYMILLEGKKSLLTPFKETDISFFDGKELKFFEGQKGYLICRALANPQTTIEIFKENGNRRQKIQNTENVISSYSVMAIKTWEDVSTDNEGQYICRGTCGDNVQEVPVNVVVIPVVLIVGSSVTKNFNIISVNIQFLVRGNKNIVTQCNAGSRNGEVIFREYSDYGLKQYFTYNDTMDIWNSSSNSSNAEGGVNQASITSSLEEYSPLVIDYSSNTDVTVQDQTLKNVTVTLDLEMSPEPPKQLACMAFIEGELYPPPSEWTTIQID